RAGRRAGTPAPRAWSPWTDSERGQVHVGRLLRGRPGRLPARGLERLGRWETAHPALYAGRPRPRSPPGRSWTCLGRLDGAGASPELPPVPAVACMMSGRRTARAPAYGDRPERRPRPIRHPSRPAPAEDLMNRRLVCLVAAL